MSQSGVSVASAEQSAYDYLYGAARGKVLWPDRPGRLIRRIMEWLPRGASVLDAGCGDGKNALYLELHGYRCEGFDCSALALQGLTNRFRAAGLASDERYIVRSLADYAVSAASYDCLVSYGLLHCLPRPDRVKEHRRLSTVVRSGGILLFSTLVDTTPLPKGHATPTVQLVTQDELKGLLAPGWRILELQSGIIEEEHPPIVPWHRHADCVDRRGEDSVIPIVVVTGADGSGKTTLSRLLERYLGYNYINVGDELANSLARVGIRVARREQLGATFLAAFGVGGYLEVISSCIERRPCVLDGVRLPQALPELRSRSDVLHLHRRGSPSGTDIKENGRFAAELGELAQVADAHVAWYPTEADLETYVARDGRDGSP